MICKFFENKKGTAGGTPSLDYLLNKQRVNNGTARILKGDENLTRELIKSLDFKQKACVGCLSFEEKNIDEN
ncbi:molybdopterin-guanine dinucleotide biosynthesis protein MobA, partial [Campylobacter jejuni]|nr:molybdopterin-guanine dinucleotide biosynthesis protein MobA [Campylobacter jejuni]